jgi:hypothetical protein
MIWGRSLSLRTGGETMIRRIAVFAIAFTVLGLGVNPTAAQVTGPGSVLYKLTTQSSYQHGCFPPCACPIAYWELAGTFRLRTAGSDGLYDHYDVTDVDWTASDAGAPPLRITGTGTYKIGGEFALMHQLSLDLVEDGRPVEHFDSGLVAGGSEFPAIVITISIHGEYCLDTVMPVYAKPAPTLLVQDGLLSWDAVPRAASYDVVRGDLSTLRGSGGNFTIATEACAADDFAGTTLPFADAPPPGAGFWFALRFAQSGQPPSSYDSGSASQIRSRDPGINAAPAACP